MGSFNITCGISGASIYEGERIGAVPIIPNQYSYNSKGIAHTTHLYIPVAPPIYGVYGDYGNIVSIEQSTVTDYLEKFYKMPVDVFTRCLQAETPMDNAVSDFFYDQDSPVIKNPYDDIDDNVLLLLGFVAVDNDADENIKMWEHRGYTLVQDLRKSENSLLSSPPSYSVFKENEMIDGTPIYPRTVHDLVEEFHQVTKTWLGMSEEKSEQANRILDITYMPFLPEVVENVLEQGDLQKTHSDYSVMVAFKKILQHFLETDDAFGFGVQSVIQEHFREVVNISRVESSHIVEDIDDWLSLSELYDVIKSANRAYMPTIGGEQHGNPYTEQVISQLLAKRSREQIQEIESY